MEWEGLDLRPLAGGFSGETFLAPGLDDAAVVRIYHRSRNPDRAPIDAALLRLVGDILPVPEVLEVRLATAETPAVLVTRRVLRGRPLDVVLDEVDEVDWERLGRSLGRALATLSGAPFLRSGMFAGPDLGVVPGSIPDDLAEWAEHHRDTGRLSAWSTADWKGLRALVGVAEEALRVDGGLPRPVLVHGDFNTKNLLVDPVTWELAGVLDWEFAHAGSPFADLGNLTRFEREPRLVAAIADAVAHFAPACPENALEKARAADLWAQIELAARPQSNTVTQLAERLLLAQARSGDLGAWPFDDRRVSVRAARSSSLPAVPRSPGPTPSIGPERAKPLS
jgi:aminoglycoside phosphotransferase (APT) family kinase protein